VVNDFYRPLRPDRGERHYLGVSRAMTTVWGVAQMGVALYAAAALERSVIAMVLSIAGFTTGTVLGLFVLGMMRRPVRSGAAIGGLVVGFLAVLAVRLGTPVAWPWYAPIGTLVTVAVATLLGRPVVANGSLPDGSPQPRAGGHG
jgi:Na+/proline symporter